MTAIASPLRSTTTVRIRLVVAVVLTVVVLLLIALSPRSSTVQLAPEHQGPPSSSEILAAMHGGQ